MLQRFKKLNLRESKRDNCEYVNVFHKNKNIGADSLE